MTSTYPGFCHNFLMMANSEPVSVLNPLFNGNFKLTVKVMLGPNGFGRIEVPAILNSQWQQKAKATRIDESMEYKL